MFIFHGRTLTFSLLYITFIFFLNHHAVAVNTPPYTPADYFLLNCGPSSTTTSPDGRSWDGDSTSKFSPSLTSTSFFSATEQNPIPAVPYTTARIIHSPITYSFPVTPGPKFIRLYFYPATYSTFNKSKSFFSVTGNNFTLLSNFSAFLTVQASNPKQYTIIKEYTINILQNQKLNITFSPNSNSPNSYAFINGIEIVSMPDSLYYKTDDTNSITLINPNGLIGTFNFENNTAMENLYRLNAGGNDVSLVDDTGMYRMWQQDDEYLSPSSLSLSVTPYRGQAPNYTTITPPYVAPAAVYSTSRTMGRNHSLDYNLTWIFSVDSGFNYLIRLHICEYQLEVTVENQRVFFIYINNQTAEKDADVIRWSTGRGFPVYRDYVLTVPDRGRSKQDLWLAMYPNMNLQPPPMYADAILNGLEIFKLSQSDGNLAGLNPNLVEIVLPPTPDLPYSQKKSSSSKVNAIIGGVIGGGVFAFLVVCVLIYRKRRTDKNDGTAAGKSSWIPFPSMSKSTKTSKTSTSSSLPSDLCRRFLISEIRSATSNFHENFVIGSGGFGNVYKGYIDNQSTVVAIKRLNPSSKQGVHEFETEIKMLSKLRHIHLVSLIGYSDDEGEMILIYDYMSNGTLRDHLYKTENPSLPWKKRLEVAIGAARGLHYLHTGAKHRIIHRDVKSTNILLDEKFTAKVSDFGLSKMGPTDITQSHVSTVVKGSFGYVDPEYFRRQQLTEKSDVYSFGVVLLEILCARPAVLQGISKDQVSLAEWGRVNYRKGTLDQIVDKNLTGQISPECLKKYGEIVYSCVADHGIERPTMGDVVWTLEFVLQLQKTAELGKSESFGKGLDHLQHRTILTEYSTSTDGADDLFSGSVGHVSTPKSSDTLMKCNDEKSD